MKTIVYILSAILWLGLAYNIQAQEVENPREELVDESWYLTKLVMDGEEMPFIPNEEIEQSLLSIFPFGNDSYVTADVVYCENGRSVIEFNGAGDNEFYFGLFTYLAEGDYWDCTTDENNNFHYVLFQEFWNNDDLALELGIPFHFTYSIYQNEDYQTLIVVNDNGDEAHYQNVPYLSIDKNEISSLNIYPNPVQESFQIENLTKKSRLKIYDLSGKEILQQEIHSSAENIDVSHLSSGLYFYGIFQEGKQVKTGKLIKE